MDLEKYSGLTTSEVQNRLKAHGYNELPSEKKRSIFRIFFDLFKEPMLLLLIAAGVIYLMIGEAQDSLMLLTAIFVVLGITFYQERKTERALDALKNLSSPRALVIRNKGQERIAGREVVIDDILILREGDRVSADCVILSETNLMVDESLLTGESLAVTKSMWNGKDDIKKEAPGGDKKPFAYSGTLITQGRGIAKVIAIGANTEMGKIGKSLQTITEEGTLLKKETAKLVRIFALIGLVLCLIVVVVYGLTRGDFLNGFLAGLTLSMSLLPEEFPVVLLVFLTLGAWRISKRKVLTRNTAAIETLGATKVFCIDKTGTLTENKMELQLLATDNKVLNLGQKKVSLNEDFHALIEYAILASQKDPFDPIEKEIKLKGEKLLQKTEHIHKKWQVIKEYPLSKTLMALSHVWESSDKTRCVIAAKGAPEAIADLCHFTKKEKEDLILKIQKLSFEGLRLIAVAKATADKENLPQDQHGFSFEFIGILGFADPIRQSVVLAIKECYSAGIRICMITGDYPGTAQYIAKQIGLKNPNNYLTGEDLLKLNFQQLREQIANINIFARIAPQQKLNIVNALKANDEIVAMTGDGVNDAPALKAANVGIAMGERGTDVARESADLVLLNDDFSSIVDSVKMGRRIFDNLKKALSYIFAIHIPIGGMALFPVVLNLPIVFFPAQIAFLELIIDPACSIVFESEKEEGDVMNKPPRKLKEPLFNRKNMIFSTLQGLVILFVVFAVYIFSLSLGYSENHIRTLTFTAIVFGNLMLIIANLSWH